MTEVQGMKPKHLLYWYRRAAAYHERVNKK